ncbi:nuclear transport factor 2 family protein [Caulobacter sp. LARHSG274]
MIRRTLILLLATPALILMPMTPAVARETASDRAAIEAIMAAFHAAVVAHDGAALGRLFMPASAWSNVLTDSAFARAQAKSAGAAKVRPGSAQAFADFVTQSKAALNPVHTNLSIRTDGAIATAWFDYVFQIDGKPQNSGSETWQLVKTAEGWRIAAIAYSSTPPSAP